MDPTSMSFQFFPGQIQASPFYTNRTEAFVELVSTSNLSMKIIESGMLKKGEDVAESQVDTRVSNIRVPAGHWLVLAREPAEQALELRLRRIQDGSGVLSSPTTIITDESVQIAAKTSLKIVRNGLTRPMTYRLVMRADKLDLLNTIYVQSGGDEIYPLSGSFILDTVVPMGGTLELRGLKGNFAGHYDLFVDG